MTTGIYKITNKINKNSYIGCSVNIEKRWSDHKSRSFYETAKEYDKVLYKAFRKYGLENFDFEIIEETTPEQLNEREAYWIKYYDTFNNGYNATPGGDNPFGSHFGEKHPNHKLTEADIRYIRELWASKTISTREMYYEFADRIAKTGFKKIYTWQTWKNILPELNTQENRDWHRNNLISYSCFGEKNPKSKISDEEREKIYQRYVDGEDLKDIFVEYSHLYKNFTNFKSGILHYIERK